MTLWGRTGRRRWGTRTRHGQRMGRGLRKPTKPGTFVQEPQPRPVLVDPVLRARAVLAAVKARPVIDVRLENMLNRRLQALFLQAGQEVLEQLLAYGIVPGDAGAQARIVNALAEMLDPFAEEMDAVGQRSADVARRRVGEDMRRIGRPVRLDAFAPRTREIISRHAFEASRTTIARMTGDVMGTLANAYAEGLGIDDAAVALRDQFNGMADWELRRVARTEINGAQSIGAQMTMEELGVEYEQWVTGRDTRVRHTHAELDGEITRLDEPFSNGLLRPGDTDGPIEEWINCRCRSRPFIMPPGRIAPLGGGPFRVEDLIDTRG